jgi:PAS domain S-box-containing protein
VGEPKLGSRQPIAVPDVQATLLRQMAERVPLPSILETLVLAMEDRAPGLIASVLLLENGRLHYGAAPNLPEGYNRAADNHPVGEGFGSCGTAAHRRELVIAGDLQADPLWRNYREIARRYRLGACWSMPIFDSGKEVVGTFALYYHEPRRPSLDELRLIQDFAQLASLAIEHHRMQEALRSSVQEFRDLVDDLEAVAWESTADRRQFTAVGRAAAPLLGHPLERWYGEPEFWASLLHPEDRETTLRRHQEAALAGARKYQAEYRLLAADGRSIWIRDIVSIERDGPGQAPRLRGVMLNISRQREAEQERDELLRKLVDEQNLVRAAIQQLPEAALVARASDGRILIANHSAERLLRMTIAGEGEERGATIEQLLCSGPAEPIEGRELVLEGAGGERRTVSLRAGLLRDRKQRVVARVAVLADLTARKAADCAQRLLADAGSTVGSSLDPGVTARSVADLAVRKFADWCLVFTQEEKGGLHCTALAHRDADNGTQAAEFERLAAQSGGIPFGIPALLAGGPAQLLSDFGPESFQPGALRPELMRLVRRLGAESAMVVPLRLRDRTLGAIVYGSARPERHFDAGDLAVAEELARRTSFAMENARLYREARASVRHREEFLSIAAHELKTPVASLQLTVQSMAEVAAKDEPDLEFLRGRANAADRQGARLGRLIDELLDVSAIQAGRIRLTPESIDLAATIKQVVSRFQDELDRRGVDVTIHAPGPVIGRWDPVRLEQVLTNLLSNALKYGEGRPVRVAVDATPEVATVEVEDQGIGMSPEVIGRIFHPFERGVPAGHYGGLGLGLYITEQIIRAQGGTIKVRSSPAQGAIFTVELPRNVPSSV